MSSVLSVTKTKRPSIGSLFITLAQRTLLPLTMTLSIPTVSIIGTLSVNSPLDFRLIMTLLSVPFPKVHLLCRTCFPDYTYKNHTVILTVFGTLRPRSQSFPCHCFLLRPLIRLGLVLSDSFGSVIQI